MNTTLRPIIMSLVIVISLMPCITRATSRAKAFPALATMKDTLGTVAVVSDFIMWSDPGGDHARVYLEDSRTGGTQLAGLFAEQMSQRGYRIERSGMLSVGLWVDRSHPYRLCPSWDQRGTDNEALPIGHAPFRVDSLLCPDSAATAVWVDAMTASRLVLRGKKKQSDPTLRVPGAMRLGELLGTDYLLYVQTVCDPGYWGAKKLGLAMVGLKKHSGTTFVLAMISCRSGEIVWADFEFYEETVIKEKHYPGYVKQLLKNMP